MVCKGYLCYLDKPERNESFLIHLPVIIENFMEKIIHKTLTIPKTGNTNLHTSKKGFVRIFPSSDLTCSNASNAGLNIDPSILYSSLNSNLSIISTIN